MVILLLCGNKMQNQNRNKDKELLRIMSISMAEYSKCLFSYICYYDSLSENTLISLFRPLCLSPSIPMETGETRTPPIVNSTTDEEATLVDEDVNEDEISPIEEVRLTVPTDDDESLPVWTFRMWFLGLLSCALLSFLNQFFSFRKEPLVISQITIQVATLPIGRFMASVLPENKFYLNIPHFGKRDFSLNPGPFNMKEHVLISIFANAGSAFGGGAAYAVYIIAIIKAFYGRHISYFASWILIVTTQVLY